MLDVAAIAISFGSVILFFGGATLFQRAPRARQIIVRTAMIVAVITMIGCCWFLLGMASATRGL